MGLRTATASREAGSVEVLRSSLGHLISEHHAATGHGPSARTLVPACEICGLLLEAMWSLEADALAS